MRSATGTIAKYSRDHYVARITTSTGRPLVHLPPSPKSPQALERARERAAYIAEQVRAGKPLPAALARAPRNAPRPRAKPAIAGSFRDVAERWTSGELARDFRDHVRAADLTLASKRLARMYPAIGDVAIRDFTIDDAERAMRAVPNDAKPATRRAYAQLIARVLSLAVWPLRLIVASPIPPRFVPRAGDPPAFAFLYPSEDAALLAHVATPLALRVLWGFLAREGMRVGEALALTWSAIDLVRGVVTLDENKTDVARAWALGADVVRALKAWRRDAPADALVFPDVEGHLAERLRAALLAAGVTRAELHANGENRARFRVHDLRGTFVTLALANGRTEAWVTDRTGHASSAMLHRYQRAARTAAELSLGPLAPLDEAVPEFRAAA